MIKEEDTKSTESVDKFSLEKNFPSELFKAKIERLNARKSPDEKSEKKCYSKAQKVLLNLLNFVQRLNINENDKKYILILILIYNDLSICYAGLDNSSMSRGYAEEARMIIEDESYKEFEQKLGPNNSSKIAGIANHEFVTSRFYDLYTITLFNQALAEKRSHSYNEAERNFRKIIRYAEKRENDNTPLRNFNYYSALLNLSDLYIDLSRGKEAIELLDKALDKLDKEKENDIRYWKGYLAMIDASIDKTKYDYAEKLLEEFFEKNTNLVKRHSITSIGFKAVNCYARCKIEKVKNTLRDIDESELKKAQEILLNNLEEIKTRKQEGLETKAYKQLSDIYKILSQDKEDKDISEYDEKVIKHLIMFISEAEPKIDNLDVYISHQKRDYWIDKCDDLNALESFTDQIIKVMTDESIDKYRDLLEKLKEKIKKECDEKGQLSRAERIVTKINDVVGEEKRIKYPIDTFDEIFRNDKKGFTLEDIRTRLDINEKEFDSVLFTRSNIQNDNHFVELIVLRRWNSFSPGLFRESTGSLGGGYLLRVKYKNESGVFDFENIVIDPGYNFLQNFRSEGFHIDDIDTIIVTHSHLDHCSELLPIMDLIFQINKRYKDYKKKERKKKRVSLCLSKGAYKKFSSFTNEGWQEQLKDVIIIENLDEKTWIPFEGLRISAIQTPHMDLGGVNAIGLMIEMDGRVSGNENNSKTVRLGFTGDTPWYQGITKHFCECDLLCVHLGSIKYQEIGYTDDRYYLKGEEKREIDEGEKKDKFKETYTKSNHLLFFGTEDIISHYDTTKEDSLIIVGEFGEELKYGLRVDLCKKLSMGKSIQCLPGDIGQYIVIKKDGTKKVRCNFCESFVRPNEITTFSYGREDAIHYICKTCDNTLSELQKQAVIEHRVTRH